MSELSALYQDVILDHNRRPRNYGPLEDANRSAQGHNPLCGDELTVWLKVDGDTIKDVHFIGKGCAISKASASIMTSAVKGRTRAEADHLFAKFHDMVTRPHGEAVSSEDEKALGSLRVFSGVSRFPARVKCASLAWHALHKALENPSSGENPPVVTSESPEDGADAS